MKKTIALILSGLLLLGTLTACATGAADGMDAPDAGAVLEPAESGDAEVQDRLSFESAVEAQAFAAAMACHNGDFHGSVDLASKSLLWSMAGWYAAWMYTWENVSLFPASATEDFLRAMGCTGEITPPESWIASGDLGVFTAPDGSDYYVFVRQLELMDSLVGVTTAVEVVAAGEDGEANAAVTESFENGAEVTWDYALDFEPNPDTDSAFAWRLTSLEAPRKGPVLLGELSFTWEELCRNNGLAQILSKCPAIQYHGEGLNEGTLGWVFPRDVGLASLFVWSEDVTGQYRGCDFEYSIWADGDRRAMVGAIDERYGSWDELETFILDNFTGLLSMALEYEDEELLWFDCVGPGGLHERLAFDRETLLLRRQEVYYSSDEEPSTTVFVYDETGPAYEFFDSWDGPMRTVTIHYESYETGSSVTRTEEAVLPADWEYFPYEARWGEYTAYMNEGYTEPYVYPGPGGDYEIYLTTAKG